MDVDFAPTRADAVEKSLGDGITIFRDELKGEVGEPLCAILSQQYDVKGIDVTSPALNIEHVDVMHICYPFQIRDFCGETARYVERFKPSLTVINSTVEVGTTRKIADWTGVDVVHSPVRGKHARMQQEMQTYTKFIGATNQSAAAKAVRHFESAGFKTRSLGSPEATELGKLAETTYFGVLIAWAQELERYCNRAQVDYDEVVSLCDEISFFPQVKYVPGIIGGHCVMPNIEILCNIAPSGLLEAVQESNRKKIECENSKKQANVTPELTSSEARERPDGHSSCELPLSRHSHAASNSARLCAPLRQGTPK